LVVSVPAEDVPRDKVKLPKRPKHDKYDSEAGLRGRHFVPEQY
jgi:polyphosphate kinase